MARLRVIAAAKSAIQRSANQGLIPVHGAEELLAETDRLFSPCFATCHTPAQNTRKFREPLVASPPPVDCEAAITADEVSPERLWLTTRAGGNGAASSGGAYSRSCNANAFSTGAAISTLVVYTADYSPSRQRARVSPRGRTSRASRTPPNRSGAVGRPPRRNHAGGSTFETALPPGLPPTAGFSRRRCAPLPRAFPRRAVPRAPDSCKLTTRARAAVAFLIACNCPALPCLTVPGLICSQQMDLRRVFRRAAAGVLCLGALYAFQRPFRQFHGVEYFDFQLTPDWQEQT